MMTMVSRTGAAACRALYLAILVAGSVCATLPAPALAQQSAPADKPKAAAKGDKSGSEVLEEVVVTGTLIRGIASAGSNVIGTTRAEIESSGATDSNQLLGTAQVGERFEQLAEQRTGGTDKVRCRTIRRRDRHSDGVLVNIQTDEGSDIVMHGLSPAVVTEHAHRRSVGGSAHSRVQPTIRRETGLYTSSTKRSRCNRGGHVV